MAAWFLGVDAATGTLQGDRRLFINLRIAYLPKDGERILHISLHAIHRKRINIGLKL
jgi:hypothetical protein